MDKRHLSFQNQLTTGLGKIGATKLVQLSLDKGQIMRKHRTPNVLNLIVLSGLIRFNLGEEEAILEANDLITVEPNCEHALEGIEKSVALLVLG